MGGGRVVDLKILGGYEDGGRGKGKEALVLYLISINCGRCLWKKAGQLETFRPDNETKGANRGGFRNLPYSPRGVGHGGRPPDGEIGLTDPPLQHPSDHPDGNGVDSPMGDPVDVRSENMGQGIGAFNSGHPSFRDMVRGPKLIGNQPISINEFDMDVYPEDVVLGVDGPLPAISFLDRVHDAIDAKLANSVVIRLLGETIGYKALLSMIKSLWNLLGEISLFDLDNDYYLVRFACEEDFSHVLTGGPWKIYGSYLTVQPWSRQFSTAMDYPMKIMVWVRLPGLPYRYYTHSLFGHIAGAIGKVLIEYEGLPTICYSCGKYGHTHEHCGKVANVSNGKAHEAQYIGKSDDLYGHWMQVMNKKRKNIGVKNIASSDTGRQITAHISGSHFEALQAIQVDDNPRSNLIQKPSMMGTNIKGVMSSSGHLNAKASGSAESFKRFNRSNLDIFQRTARGTSTKAQNKGLAVVKGLSRKGLKTRKKDEKMTSKPVLAEWISAMNSELNRARIRVLSSPIVLKLRACSMMGGGQHCFITFVYASPTIGIRSRLWRHLRELDSGSGDHAHLKAHAITFFQNLCMSERMVSNTEIGRCNFFCYGDDALQPLLRDISLEEVRSVIFCMAPLKAPGADADWVNQTLLVLIPKVEEKQASFVPGRQITDNIILAQQVIHLMTKKMGIIGWMAIKILWNGDLTDSFKPTRGIRQSDPLSPYLFVLCMERLSQAIKVKVVSEDWKEIHLSKEGHGLSHLFFADDLMLFAKALMDQVSMIKGVLDRFCDESGHRISSAKTQIFFSSIYPVSTRHAISQRFGFEEVKDLGKLGGEVSYLQVIPIYVMQSTWLPKGLCVEMEKIIRRLVYGSNNGGTGIPLVKWESMQQPIKLGGVGIRNLYNQNKAFLMKVGFQLISNSEKLWVRTIRGKYKWDSLVPISLSHANGSRLWKGLRYIWSELYDNIAWNIQDGRDTDFWYDHWLDTENRLVFSYKGACTPRPTSVCDMVLPSDYLSPDTPSMARNMWVRVIKTEKLNEFLALPYKIWIERNLRAAEVYARMNDNWDIRFSVRCTTNPSLSISRSILSWTRPPTGWIKGNSDGAVRTCDNTAATGGILRNSEGEWIFSLTRSLVWCSILIAEPWGVHDLLLHAWRLGIRKIELETDNLEVMKICNFSSDALVGRALVTKIHELLELEWITKVSHICREHNMVVDRLVALSQGAPIAATIFLEPPLELSSTLLRDLQTFS
ncbi:hypothetical protein F3Y22_tig00116951pilonHSYRG00405 [Hibiscus syriacus]|uniref:CCHC-type domain-containing protein n=1 Tax=Hibiscus syriacus TaxID=106335 RepID=A0A6A2XEQ1_HIBSY|nr:hypothetical protein F3Y22_tig00116951pilonHSYRG00405 [Hibiscus syriacus]